MQSTHLPIVPSGDVQTLPLGQPLPAIVRQPGSQTFPMSSQTRPLVAAPQVVSFWQSPHLLVDAQTVDRQSVCATHG